MQLTTINTLVSQCAHSLSEMRTVRATCPSCQDSCCGTVASHFGTLQCFIYHWWSPRHLLRSTSWKNGQHSNHAMGDIHWAPEVQVRWLLQQACNQPRDIVGHSLVYVSWAQFLRKGPWTRKSANREALHVHYIKIMPTKYQIAARCENSHNFNQKPACPSSQGSPIPIQRVNVNCTNASIWNTLSLVSLIMARDFSKWSNAVCVVLLLGVCLTVKGREEKQKMLD